MRKIVLLIIGMIAGVILILNIGPLILLGISAWIGYLIFKQFLKSNSTTTKIMWVVLGLIVIALGLSNFYSIIGIGACIILYLIIKQWNKHDHHDDFNTNDPFVHFDDQWADLNK